MRDEGNDLPSSVHGDAPKKESEGAQVLQEVVQLTGLPEELLDNELSDLLGASACRVNEMTLEQLRSVLMNYIETLQEEISPGQSRH